MTQREKGWCAATAMVCAAALAAIAACAAAGGIWRRAGGDVNAALARNIARGIYANPVCEACGETLDGE